MENLILDFDKVFVITTVIGSSEVINDKIYCDKNKAIEKINTFTKNDPLMKLEIITLEELLERKYDDGTSQNDSWGNPGY